MENIYSEEQKITQSFKSSRKTIDFLLSYSQSFTVVDCDNHKFEVTLN